MVALFGRASCVRENVSVVLSLVWWLGVWRVARWSASVAVLVVLGELFSSRDASALALW
jgi:hypothetical protein